jgi:myo-inositol 2-dehydrogenase/D-chiro-inositol 1-dehydrogenase
MSQQNISKSGVDNRRGFLKKSLATTAALAVGNRVSASNAVGVHVGGSDVLRIGLIGAGGRGTAAAIDALTADPNSEVVAIGDAFADRTGPCLESLLADAGVSSRVKVDPERVFTGFDSYKQVVDSGVDVVLLCTPPHFRPQQLRYAVESGKHVFVEKPVGVDVPGVRNVLESCKIAAEKGLSVLSGLCWRYDLGVLETMRQVQEEKAIGDIVAIESSYNAGTLWHRGDDPKWSRMEYQMRNWLYYTWLSGDHILEQAIHSIDKTAWLLGDASPTRAMALGGRQQRTDPKWGHIWDHFTVFYEYPSGQRVYFTCRQQDGTDVRVDERVLGTEGQALILKNALYDRAGETTWRYRGEKPSMYRLEHQAFFKSIRSGKGMNNGSYMCNSTMIGLMGRMAAYTGKDVTWDEVYNSQERLGPAEYAWGDMPESPVAMPGITEVA